MVPLGVSGAVLPVAEFPAAVLGDGIENRVAGTPGLSVHRARKYRLVKEKFPLLASFMLVDTNDYAIARRGTEEQILAKEKTIDRKAATERSKIRHERLNGFSCSTPLSTY